MHDAAIGGHDRRGRRERGAEQAQIARVQRGNIAREAPAAILRQELDDRRGRDMRAQNSDHLAPPQRRHAFFAAGVCVDADGRCSGRRG